MYVDGKLIPGMTQKSPLITWPGTHCWDNMGADNLGSKFEDNSDYQKGTEEKIIVAKLHKNC